MCSGKLFSLVAAMLLSFESGVEAATYDLEPVYMGAVGHYAPLDFYPVAVAVGQNYVFIADLFRSEVQVRAPGGGLVNRFPLQDSWIRDIDVDTLGNVYTADANDNKIRKYSSTGQLLLQIGSSGTSPGQFVRLRAITVDESGTIYAADSTTELSAFDSHGNLLWNTKNSGDPSADLIHPQGIARDSAGNLYVADNGRQQIIIFNSTGQYLRALGPDGEGSKFLSPVGVAVSPQGTIFVLERLQLSQYIGQNQVFKFSNAGQLLASWGAKGRGTGELWEQQGITLGPDGSVWVAGYMGHNVVRYDQSGNVVEEWDAHNIKAGELARVRGATVGSDGLLYVTDFWNQLVQVFDRHGRFRFMWGERGQGDGQYFNFPRFTATNAAGDVFVSDDREVRQFAADGTFLRRSDAISFPGGIEVDNQGSVWVTGTGENSIRRYSPTLQLLNYISGSRIPGGLNSPFGIATGPNGKIYVADSRNHRIIRLSNTGIYEFAWGSLGHVPSTVPGKFSSPVGITIDSKGRVYVSETWGHRIQVFTPDGAYLYGWGVPGQTGEQPATPYEVSGDGDYFLYASDYTFGQAEVHKYALVPAVKPAGQPGYVPGQDPGYFIWSDDGSYWHLRWSGDGVLHEFSGSISSTVPFTHFNGVNIEPGDLIESVSDSIIGITATESNGQDGVDFIIDGNGILTFDLKIDGVEHAEQVKVGMNHFIPDTLPLPLKTQPTVAPDPSGKPAYQPGKDRGYFIWQDADDGEWHIRWNGDGVHTDRFSGTITAPGMFTSVREYSFESNDSLANEAGSLGFDAYAGAGHDGVDFFLPEGSGVVFDLYVNEASAADLVYIGKSRTSSPAGTVIFKGLQNLLTTGRPAYVPAKDAGYFLWQDADDSEWHLRWSGDSITTSLYDGLITSTLPITDVSKYSIEPNDSLTATPNEIRFNALAGAGEDGVDFHVPEGAIVSLDLFSNQSANAGDIRVGSTGANPTAAPFNVLSAATSISPAGMPSYVPAHDAGYYLWRDTDDGEWHLRWSGDSITTFSYHGTIKSSAGITQYSPYSFESNDQVTPTPAGLDFSGPAGTGEDGLDFFVPAGSQLIFNLAVDDKHQPSSVSIGNRSTKPATIPFSLPSP